MNKWINIKVPKKYQDKVHTIRKCTEKYHEIYIAYLTSAHWIKYALGYVTSILWAKNRVELFKQIEKLK